MPIDQAARHCGVSIGMLSKLENGKGVNLEHALRVLDGLGLTMLVVPKANASWLEECGPCVQDRRAGSVGLASLTSAVSDPAGLAHRRLPTLTPMLTTNASNLMAFAEPAVHAKTSTYRAASTGCDAFADLDGAPGERLACSCCARFASSGRTCPASWPASPGVADSLAQLDYRARELVAYVDANGGAMINYGARHRHNKPISTAPAESAVNQVLNQRMCKRQQLRWSPNGVHLLAQVRCAVINGDLVQRLARYEPPTEPRSREVVEFLEQLGLSEFESQGF